MLHSLVVDLDYRYAGGRGDVSVGGFVAVLQQHRLPGRRRQGPHQTLHWERSPVFDQPTSADSVG